MAASAANSFDQDAITPEPLKLRRGSALPGDATALRAEPLNHNRAVVCHAALDSTNGVGL